jgi:hypothetical protein
MLPVFGVELGLPVELGNLACDLYAETRRIETLDTPDPALTRF